MVAENNIFADCSCCSDCADDSQDTQANGAGGCSCGPGCCDATKDTNAEKRLIVIDFLYLDLSVCTRVRSGFKPL